MPRNLYTYHPKPLYLWQKNEYLFPKLCSDRLASLPTSLPRSHRPSTYCRCQSAQDPSPPVGRELQHRQHQCDVIHQYEYIHLIIRFDWSLFLIIHHFRKKQSETFSLQWNFLLYFFLLKETFSPFFFLFKETFCIFAPSKTIKWVIWMTLTEKGCHFLES